MKAKFGVTSDLSRATRANSGHAVLMQDGAPAHTSRSTQAWLLANLGEDGFWPKSWWPPSSPDCNPLDYSGWNELVRAVCATTPKSRDDLVQRLEGSWHQVLNRSYIIKTCAIAFDRLRHVVEADGAHIEAVVNMSDPTENN